MVRIIRRIIFHNSLTPLRASKVDRDRDALAKAKKAKERRDFERRDTSESSVVLCEMNPHEEGLIVDRKVASLFKAPHSLHSPYPLSTPLHRDTLPSGGKTSLLFNENNESRFPIFTDPGELISGLEGLALSAALLGVRYPLQAYRYLPKVTRAKDEEGEKGAPHRIQHGFYAAEWLRLRWAIAMGCYDGTDGKKEHDKELRDVSTTMTNTAARFESDLRAADVTPDALMQTDIWVVFSWCLFALWPRNASMYLPGYSTLSPQKGKDTTSAKNTEAFPSWSSRETGSQHLTDLWFRFVRIAVLSLHRSPLCGQVLRCVYISLRRRKALPMRDEEDDDDEDASARFVLTPPPSVSHSTERDGVGRRTVTSTGKDSAKQSLRGGELRGHYDSGYDDDAEDEECGFDPANLNEASSDVTGDWAIARYLCEYIG